ncbi:bifunctional hydroxymethylpyrimidine kinase/phosphomethylpyrimidine kinase [Pantoea sp. Mhis]|uniref:bifunctional hydroxymethylpyrimidine kinase/phosphomethylpyrimidine kinase n=1 Tax=Pantoea sp. Mhis TaxID=2576759 RepID=UPI001358CC1F|nr:bifunctional hydroxymethylpyrimidine kinase/phosphomethylpyrimidine kinase [Pantoea sp. Mhis]MXP56152.1 bifunctional hydroxymethylpyrimidine kinase/phosphomethylpyrimidine kinase [Pantoea sp. Mhis]
MKQINALTIAGTDPIGGAGIQADLKVFAALGVYGTSVVTALIAQNTCGVQSIYRIKSDFIKAQLNSVLDDIQIDSVKIGMLSESSIIQVIAEKLKIIKLPFIVLDTVMVAKSGDLLLSMDAVVTMRNLLLPQVSIITPNLFEASRLLECSVAEDEKTMISQGYALLKFGCEAVLIKGGHLKHIESPDWLITCNGHQRFTAPRLNTRHTHGTGCSLSAALAALRPSHDSWNSTITEAKIWLHQALLHSDSLKVGNGKRPIHHLYKWW